VKIKVALILLLLVGAVGVRYWDSILDEGLLLMLGNSTIYSSDYSEELFDSIEIGDSVEDVYETLSAPFDKWQFQNENGNTVKVVEYSKSTEDSHYRKRMIFFIKDRVFRKVKAVHID